MKTEDFERLKAKLGDEFEIIQDALVSIDGTIAFVRKKDIWDGVEFGKHYLTGKIVNFASNPELMMIKDYFLNYIARDIYTPSTEQAYIEQLKKEAHERFGEIKEGDRFEADWLIDDVAVKCSKSDFVYLNYGDLLLFNSTVIYKQGKWATRVKERVKVELIHETLSNNPTYQFKLTNWNETNRAKESGQFLASQLEKYLNREIE